jgi:hypothetical protein
MTYFAMSRTNRWTLLGCVAVALLMSPMVRAQAVPADQSQKPAGDADQSDAQKEAQKEREEAQKEAQKARDEARKERDRALRDAQRERDETQKEAQKARNEAQKEREQALREAQRGREEAQRMRDEGLRQRDDVMRLVGANVKLVKDKPFSAEAVTESVQVLADGNRIVRRNQTNYFRDSSGRTRREQTLSSLGPESMAAPMKTIFIFDPVAGVDYVLDAQSKRARKVPSPKMEFEVGPMKPKIQLNLNLPHMDKAAERKEETLPNKTIEGLNCTGTRTTITIPAGSIGNEQPIAMVQETWYSPDIEAVVQSTTSDPRTGTTSYKLLNVKRTDPPADLFAPPADYTVNDRDYSKGVSIKIDTRTDTKIDTKVDSKPN